MSKYRSNPCVIDSIRFASQKEGKRYQELLLLQKAKKICNLKLQPKFLIEINGKKICTYIADFEYDRILTASFSKNGGFLERICEDCKGFKTPIYRLKKKLMNAVYGIIITET